MATNALRFGRPLVPFTGVGAPADDATFAPSVAAAAEDALSLFDRPAIDFLFDSFKAIANDFGLPPPETGDFLIHDEDDLGETLD